jgi:tartrate/fumarate subfamily iron-sulfur-dependent hydro-lyase beta chain
MAMRGLDSAYRKKGVIFSNVYLGPIATEMWEGKKNFLIATPQKAAAFIGRLLKNKKRLPVDLKKAVIYYCGPSKTRPAAVIGSCGPTTSARMDVFAPILIKAGLRGMIGKGNRSRETAGVIKKYKAVYFITVGGAGAYLSKMVKKAKVIAFRDLGPEAIYKLEVRDFPVIVWNK